MANSALITQITPLSSHDGPGMRTTLFFKGCSLCCRWCHNPETISVHQQAAWRGRLCIGCGGCIKRAVELGVVVDSPAQITQLQSVEVVVSCAEVCPSRALKLVAREWSVEGVAKEIMKSAPLNRAMGGGVTFSGGEPALHGEFIEQVMDRLDDQKLHYALDSCGQVAFATYERLIPRMDLLLFDVKECDDVKHKEFTGSSNSMIFDNLRRAAKMIVEQELRCRIWIRTPLIPTMTATTENVVAIAELLKSLPSGVVERWELCSFNNMCKNKYHELSILWSLDSLDLLSSEQSSEFLSEAKRVVDGLFEVSLSGLTSKRR